LHADVCLMVVAVALNAVMRARAPMATTLEECILDPANVTRLTLQRNMPTVRRVEWAEWVAWTCKEPRGS
jgi:hypothetical protein